MTRIDWDQMLTGLEQQKTGLEQELADVDAVIHAVRQRAAPSVRVADIAKARAATNGTRKTSAKQNGAKGGRASAEETEQVKAKARKLWEQDVPVAAIAKQVGRAVGSIYAWSSEGKWKRPNPGAVAKPAAAAPVAEPAGTQLAGSVRCTNEDCGVYTNYDPCAKCGKPLKRKGW